MRRRDRPESWDWKQGATNAECGSYPVSHPEVSDLLQLADEIELVSQLKSEQGADAV